MDIDVLQTWKDELAYVVDLIGPVLPDADKKTLDAYACAVLCERFRSGSYPKEVELREYLDAEDRGAHRACLAVFASRP